MPFTNEEVLRMTEIALQRHNVFDKSSTPIGPTYQYPSDWINIDDCPANSVCFLVSDLYTSAYSIYLIQPSGGTTTITWGDGSSEVLTNAGLVTHTYAVGTGQVCSRGYTTFKLTMTGSLTWFACKPVVSGTSTPDEGSGMLACVINNINITGFTLKDSLLSPLDYYVFEYFKVKSASIVSFNEKFYQFYKLGYLDLSGITTNTITSMTSMCYSCSGLTDVILGNMGRTTTAYRAFYGCAELKSIDLSTYAKDIVVGLGSASLNYAFENCYSLETVIFPESPVAIVDTSGMFFNCYSLEEVDLTCLKYGYYTSYMFQNCTSLKNVDLSQITSFQFANYMFDNTPRLRSCVFPQNITSGVDARFMFRNSGIEEISINNVSFSTMQNMFYNCTRLTKATLTNCANSGTSIYLFYNCTSLLTVDLTGSLSASTIASYMFQNCTALISANINSLANVTTAIAMFQNCWNLKTLTSNLFAASATSVSMSLAFDDCIYLQDINLSSAKLSILTAIGSPTRLTRLNTITWHPSSTFNGTTVSVDIKYNDLSDSELNTIFTALPSIARTIDITGCTGTATCDRTIATSKGWTVVG